VGHDKIENIDQYRALSRVVKAATVRCCKHNATRQWQVGDTHLWSLCTALASHAHHLVLLWPFVVVQCYAMDRDIVTNLQWNSMDLHMPYSKVLARMTLSDLEWLSEIFDDTEHRTVSATAELFVQYSPCDLCTMSVVADSRKSHMSSFCSAETQQHSFSRVVNYSRQKKVLGGLHGFRDAITERPDVANCVVSHTVWPSLHAFSQNFNNLSMQYTYDSIVTSAPL